MVPGPSGETKSARPSSAVKAVLIRRRSVSTYPPKLTEIIELFEMLPEEEKRENLVAYSEQAKKWEPKEGDQFVLEDVRKDEECTDTVGIFLQVDGDRRTHFNVTLGPQVQTLTKAMTAILCRGLDGSTIEEILELPADFVPRIVGGQLVRIRSQTVYYILTRMKGACTGLSKSPAGRVKAETVSLQTIPFWRHPTPTLIASSENSYLTHACLHRHLAFVTGGRGFEFNRICRFCLVLCGSICEFSRATAARIAGPCLGLRLASELDRDNRSIRCRNAEFCGAGATFCFRSGAPAEKRTWPNFSLRFL